MKNTNCCLVIHVTCPSPYTSHFVIKYFTESQEEKKELAVKASDNVSINN